MKKDLTYHSKGDGLIYKHWWKFSLRENWKKVKWRSYTIWCMGGGGTSGAQNMPANK